MGRPGSWASRFAEQRPCSVATGAQSCEPGWLGSDSAGVASCLDCGDQLG